METVDIASKLQRFMKAQLANLTTVITSGGVGQYGRIQSIYLDKFVHTNFYYRKSLTC
jgi:uncharacterized protein YcbK (DUF882 family)